MIIVNTRMPKLCFAKPGACVQLFNSSTGEIDNDLYIVCVFNQSGKRPAPALASNGLYSDERPLFLVNLCSGEAIPMPHLSSRIQLIKDAHVVVPTEGSDNG